MSTTSLLPLRQRMKNVNLNTVLSALILAVGGWTLKSIDASNREMAAAVVKIDNQSREMVDVKVKLIALENQIISTRIQLAGLEEKVRGVK